ncbi:DUF6233 domain-containing protein [Streptomyces xiangluensis]|uniref:DUF6233 domain-containing protein n=1 Tax=Streptomyces xiangluensis TaxID=2665720 RepID=A0ABV8YKZ4_9ACTN
MHDRGELRQLLQDLPVGLLRQTVRAAHMHHRRHLARLLWHAMWLQRIDRKIATLQRRQAEEERGRRSRPRPPDWIVEHGIGTGRPPVQVRAGDCHMAGSRRRPVDRDEARRLLAAGLPGRRPGVGRPGALPGGARSGHGPTPGPPRCRRPRRVRRRRLH